MKDYSCVSLLESANIEMAEQFVEAVKLLDKDISTKRLYNLLHANNPGADFNSIVGQFLAIKNTKTSVDF